MTSTLLPEGFGDLEKYAEEWDLRSTNERYIKRLSSNLDELKPLYDAVFERFEDIKTYLDSKPMDSFADADKRLGRLMFAFATIAPAVVSFKQVRVPDCESVPMFDVQVEVEL